MKNTSTIFVSLVLGLITLTTAGCGQLPPEKMAQFDRENEERANREDPTQNLRISLSELNIESKANPQIEYSITYLNALRSFAIQVTSRNGQPTSQLITLGRSDLRDTYDVLKFVFAERAKLKEGACPNCNPNMSATVVQSSGISMTIRSPQLITNAPASGKSVNLIDELNRFILNR